MPAEISIWDSFTEAVVAESPWDDTVDVNLYFNQSSSIVAFETRDHF